jgi:membrane associated rhomboid family serine protease
VWIAINIASGVSGWPYDVDVQIAWVAHIGGYVCGFLLIRPLDPRRAAARF